MAAIEVGPPDVPSIKSGPVHLAARNIESNRNKFIRPSDEDLRGGSIEVGPPDRGTAQIAPVKFAAGNVERPNVGDRQPSQDGLSAGAVEVVPRDEPLLTHETFAQVHLAAGHVQN